MRIVLDIEANGLEAPTEVWVICCLDVDTGDQHIFRKVTSDANERERFLEFSVAAYISRGEGKTDMDALMEINAQARKVFAPSP